MQQYLIKLNTVYFPAILEFLQTDAFRLGFCIVCSISIGLFAAHIFVKYIERLDDIIEENKENENSENNE